MNDDLPEIFQQLKPPSAPAHLRSRVLAAVNGELAKHRKPRWERVLELSVAASFVLGVVLNADVLTSGIQGIAAARQEVHREVGQECQLAQEVEPANIATESSETYYAKYLAQLSAKLPG